MAALQLVSHHLCPYVQRIAIALAEKGARFERITVDLASKPEWFVKVSPRGKVPLLIVDGAVLFESAAILEYLEDAMAPRLHPADPVERARHRGWMEFGSGILDAIAGLYNAPNAASFAAKRQDLVARFERLEETLGDGPWFSGRDFSLVDAVFAPVFRYFDVFERIGVTGMLQGLPKLARWRRGLAARPSVVAAVDHGYWDRLETFLANRASFISGFARLAA